MGKWINDTVLDQALEYIANNGSQLDVTSDSATPTDLTNSLASTALTTGTGGADYAIANGDSSGRKLTISEQADIGVSTSGTARHIVISDGTSSPTLHLVTTCTEQSLTSGNTVTVPAWDDEIADPS